MNPDFRDMLSALSAEGVEYPLVGAYAVAFDEAWASRRTTDVDGLEVPVLGFEALVRNKRATGRPRDLADAEQLEGSRNEGGG